MEILKVTSNEFKQIYPSPVSLFNSVAFVELNKYKCVEVHYLLFKDKKFRLGIILGENHEFFMAPFSASYSGFCYNTNVGIQYYNDAAKLIVDYVKMKGKKLKITIAPTIYDSTDAAKTLNAFILAGLTLESVEYNQHFELRNFNNYFERIDSKVRNKLKNVLKDGKLRFSLLNASSLDDVSRFYNVIKINHMQKNRPLHMSLHNILETIKIIPADFFMVTDEKGNDIASALIFHTSKKIFQVVYWGDIPDYSNYNAMNFLAYNIFQHYYHKGLEILDIGISTEYGVPNVGLCEFKENIGCISTSRFTLSI